MTALIVSVAVPIALACRPHPFAWVSTPGARRRDDKCTDLGSPKDVLVALAIGAMVSAVGGCLSWLLVSLMDNAWLSQFLPPSVFAVSVAICAVMLAPPLFSHCVEWLSTKRLILILLVDALVIYAWATVDSWMTNNLLGAVMTVHGILVLQFRMSFLRLSLILLVIAVLYDAWQVYETANMVELAEASLPTQPSAPVTSLPTPAEASERALSVPGVLLVPSGLALHSTWTYFLGMGDVLIVGVMVVTAARVGRRVGSRVPFFAALTGFAVAISVTVVVADYFRAAQPALIFIVPACAGGVMVCARCSGYWDDLKKPVYGSEMLTPTVQQDLGK